GKDSAIRHVMSGLNPQGCNVTSFKHPSEEELDHDFLWRTTKHTPARGMIGVFNRSYYEEVLIARVHPRILRAQKIPKEVLDEKKIWKERFESINDFEKHLHRNGTKIVKFFLHLSKAEQKKRFLRRIERSDKNWKFTKADVEERKVWPKYQAAYEDAISHTSHRHAPWYVVPADDKHNARLIVSEVILETLRELKLKPPVVTAQQRAELEEVQKTL
ncbi:MAG TPA: PPK2 family polyphosphate kinase, partial [Polyangiaceae bacterium]